MAAPAIAVERYRVEHGQGFTMPVISLTDRRAAGNRLVRFVFQRHLETVLYGRSEGSSGPIWKAMNAAGIGSTTMTINKAAVTAGLVTDDEFKAIMDTFKSALPADVVDPCSLGRIRNCTTVVRTFGRSPASMAWLRALSQPVPQAWELRAEQEANDAAGEVDLLLNDKLDDANFEADEASPHFLMIGTSEMERATLGLMGRAGLIDFSQIRSHPLFLLLKGPHGSNSDWAALSPPEPKQPKRRQPKAEL